MVHLRQGLQYEQLPPATSIAAMSYYLIAHKGYRGLVAKVLALHYVNGVIPAISDAPQI